jgi:hypothetical protein
MGWRGIVGLIVGMVVATALTVLGAIYVVTYIHAPPDCPIRSRDSTSSRLISGGEANAAPWLAFATLQAA